MHLNTDKFSLDRALGQIYTPCYSKERSDFYAKLKRVEREALCDNWQAFIIACAFLSVVRPGRTVELYNFSRLDDDCKVLLFDICSLKDAPGWCAEALDWLASRLESRWRHKLVWDRWQTMVSKRIGNKPKGF